MGREDVGERWEELSAGVAREMKEWRAGHPRATLREIEAALDERWARVRAQILEEAAVVSPLADVRAAQASGTEVRCPECGQALAERGRARRRVTTQGDQALTLERSYAVCPGCGAGLFPPG
jgi:YgiT-type zinc finger domain-containing protein